ncbi:hypothetical protein O181_008588 [Austropuccinia psidii MF-1]|uniref:Uncharacterized protein n=1 Tax=Austropuccinia psidii MF-1 TaxID=1389203 RepID=A0A9Q3BPF3_9BASI|nr:hypothetical protein [Austropuccinia psidii MF-1]
MKDGVVLSHRGAMEELFREFSIQNIYCMANHIRKYSRFHCGARIPLLKTPPVPYTTSGALSFCLKLRLPQYTLLYIILSMCYKDYTIQNWELLMSFPVKQVMVIPIFLSSCAPPASFPSFRAHLFDI